MKEERGALSAIAAVGSEGAGGGSTALDKVLAAEAEDLQCFVSTYVKYWRILI